MPRRAHRRGLVFLVALALVLGLATGADAAPRAPLTGQAWRGDRPDPAVLLIDGAFVAYTTNTRVRDRVVNVPVWTRSVEGGWAFERDALPRLGRWAVPGRTWAPGVLAVAGGYLLYYTAEHRALRRPDGGPLQCIGVATSATPMGPFVDDRDDPLVCQRDLGGSIDANPFTSGTQTFLLWKSDENSLGHTTSRLFAAPLRADGLALEQAPSVLLARDRAWEGPLVENPALLPDGQGAFLLLYSANRWATGQYATGYARCTTPLGPCTKVTTARPWLSSFGAEAGPGGADVVVGPHGQRWLAYHAWSPGREGYRSGGRRALVLRTLAVRHGVPVVGLAV